MIRLHFTQKVESMIAITTDIWTSKYKIDPFMGITAHWVSDNWDLRNIGLAMFPLKGSHTGSNIKESFIVVIDLKFDMLKKV